MVLGYVFLSSFAAFGAALWALLSGQSLGVAVLAFYGAGFGMFLTLLALGLLRGRPAAPARPEAAPARPADAKRAALVPAPS